MIQVPEEKKKVELSFFQVATIQCLVTHQNIPNLPNFPLSQFSSHPQEQPKTEWTRSANSGGWGCVQTQSFYRYHTIRSFIDTDPWQNEIGQMSQVKIYSSMDQFRWRWMSQTSSLQSLLLNWNIFLSVIKKIQS